MLFGMELGWKVRTVATKQEPCRTAFRLELLSRKKLGKLLLESLWAVPSYFGHRSLGVAAILV